MFYLHPWEFLKDEDMPQAGIMANVLLRRYSGKKAWKIFEEFVLKEKCRWVSCREYLKIVKC